MEGGGVFERSLVGCPAPTRAASRVTLVSFCFKLKAFPKSKMPMTITSSNGRATANSTICEPAESVRREHNPGVVEQLISSFTAVDPQPAFGRLPSSEV